MIKLGTSVLVLGAILALAGNALAQQTVPIAPAPQATTPDLSKINPTAGPAKAKPAKKMAKKVKSTQPAKPLTRAQNDRREVQAANWLEANGYRDFSNLHRVGSRYQATVADPSGPYTVTINPATGHIDPASKAVDRETRALNAVNQQQMGTVTGIRPALGGGYLAKVKSGDQSFDVFVDPDSDKLTRLD